MNPVRAVGAAFFQESLQKTGPSLTFARLCTSKHLGDLQWIVFIVVVLFPLLVWYSGDHPSSWMSFSGLLAISGAILNWTYQTGSRRLGSVDLFAYEISAICRVCLVVDFASNSAVAIRRSQTADAQGNEFTGQTEKDRSYLFETDKFTSAENYTPVYDRNVTDLQPLDANVVTAVTEFYTYRKTLMDYLRRISAEPAGQNKNDLIIQMIYMQFLMYESGRHSVEELIEYEPNRDESIINILCSEIVAWHALVLEYGPEDYRGSRLRLRQRKYEDIIPAAICRARSARDESWARARDTAAELERRYKSTIRARP